ncbi:Transducin beta protein 3 [Daphnia magna]|uniref:Transducin beta protein 3 n=1 Tax=Daphnia magna TaxID=35525 RepID=A0A162CAN5_9CRUS|nr:Transducin beta protein 3 [Daphnia magna]
MAPPPERLKANYNVSVKLEPFFTGGKVQVNKDGEFLLCQCGDRIHVIDTKYGKTIRSLVQEEDEVITFAIGLDDETLVSSHKSGLLRHWNWKDGSVVRTWKSLHLTPVIEIVFDTTTTLVASGGTDGSLKIWDIRRQYCTHNLKGGSGVYSIIKFHPDPKMSMIFGASMDCKIRCWDLKTSKILGVLEGHFSAVTGFTIFTNLNQAVSSGRDKVLIHWDLKTYSQLRIIPTYECTESLVPIEFGEPMPMLNVTDVNNPHVISAGERGVLRIWNVKNGTEVFTQTDSLVSQPIVEGAPTITQIEYNKVSDHLYVITFDHNIIVHQTKDLALVKQYAGYNDDILDIAWFGEGETHLAVATNSIHVKVYDIETMNCTLLKGHTDLVLALATSKSDFSILVTSSKDNSVRVWKMSQSPFEISCIAQGNAHTGSVGSVALSRSKLSFLVSGSQDTCLKIWKLTPIQVEGNQNLSVLHTVVAHDKDINAVCISPNDNLIASGSQDKLAKIWSSSDLKLLGVLRGHRRGLWAVQFSPADQILASGSTDGNIMLWSLIDYSCLKTLEGHESSVLRIHFVSKGYQLVSAASDGLIKLWTIKTSECVATMDAHQSKVWALAVKSDDSLLVSGAGDSALILWKDVTKEEREAAVQEKEKRILEEQQLANLMQKGLLLEALGLAIHLDQPFRTLNILKELMDQGESALTDLEKMVVKLSTNQKDSLLRYSTTWNTNSRHCHQAQMVLNILLANHTPEELFSLPSMKSAIAGLLMYNERHMQRLSRLRLNTAILPYTAAKIQATRSDEVMETN